MYKLFIYVSKYSLPQTTIVNPRIDWTAQKSLNFLNFHLDESVKTGAAFRSVRLLIVKWRSESPGRQDFKLCSIFTDSSRVNCIYFEIPRWMINLSCWSSMTCYRPQEKVMFSQDSTSHSVHNRPHDYSFTAHPCYGAVGVHLTGIFSCWLQFFVQ